jgi:hypothetical protein
VDGSTIIRPSSRAVFRELTDGTAVVLNLETSGYHGLNRLGTLIWGLLGAGPSFDQILSEIGSRFAPAPPSLEADITEFLTMLHERQLVEFWSTDGAAAVEGLRGAKQD